MWEDEGIANIDFPSFSEGLSLRGTSRAVQQVPEIFPFLFGGTFIEGLRPHPEPSRRSPKFPFLFGGTFIEG